jgi:hypothetical protein
MKKLLLLVILVLPFAANAQSDSFGYKTEDKYLYYGDVVKVDTTLMPFDLYQNAKLFVHKLSLVNPKVTNDDKNEGIVAFDVEESSTFKTQTGIGTEPMTVKYSIKLEVKKGRYRYTFDSIVITFSEKDKDVAHSLYELDKDRDGGILKIGRSKRVLKAMDALIDSKIELMANTMSKRSNDF